MPFFFPPFTGGFEFAVACGEDLLVPPWEFVFGGDVADGGVQADRIVVFDELADDAAGVFQDERDAGTDTFFFEDTMPAFDFAVGVGVVFAAFVVGGEGGLSVVEEGLLPEVEEIDGDAVFLTDVGERDLIDQVFSKQGDLLLRAVVTPLPGHGCSSARVLPLTLTKANSHFDWGNTAMVKQPCGIEPRLARGFEPSKARRRKNCGKAPGLISSSCHSI